MGTKANEIKIGALKGTQREDLEEINNLIERVRKINRDYVRRLTDKDKLIEEIKHKYSAMTKVHEELINEAFDTILKLAEKNKVFITQEGKTKTGRLPAGEIAWQSSGPATLIKNVEKAIEFCRSLKEFEKFLRPKVELNKEAMLDNKEKARQIPGVSFVESEKFIVRPFDSDCIFLKDLEMLKKTVKTEKIKIKSPKKGKKK